MGDGKSLKSLDNMSLQDNMNLRMPSLSTLIPGP